MRRRGAWLALVMGFVLASGCGGGDSGGDTPRTTTTNGGAATTSSDSVTTTTEASTTTVVPGSPYEEFIADPVRFFDGQADVVEPKESLLGNSPDYATTDTFRAETVAQGIDLTGVDVLVWPVPATDDVFLVFSFDTTATAFEEGDEGDALGMAMATSSALEAAGITQLVITWQGSDADGPFSMTFMAPFDEVRRATLEGTDLEQDDVFAHVSRGQS
ncbi:MAG: hypothetical protein HKO87_01275 [Acidimicrobiia bacterium]|nr:hypothetical protein [Acidimicrobiia bacterium]